MTDDKLRAELLRRMEADQEIRRPRKKPLTQEEGERWAEIDRDNTHWLLSVVRDRGWPLLSEVGEDGALAAWLLAQHADASPEVQREFHVLLAGAVDREEASARNLAYLEDRVRVNSGRPQLYGTQFLADGDGVRPQPIEDPERLAERRASVGLGPFEEYEAEMRRLNGDWRTGDT